MFLELLSQLEMIFPLTSHDVSPAVEIDHDGSLLGVELGAVHVEVEAVLVT